MYIQVVLLFRRAVLRNIKDVNNVKLFSAFSHGEHFIEYNVDIVPDYSLVRVDK